MGMFRLVVLLVLLTFIDLTVESVSETIPCVDIPCLCCRSGNCTESRERKNLCEGCIAGYTGLTCIEPCPANCVNCSQLFLESERTCYQCKNGFYNGRYQDLPNQPLQQDCALPCKTDCKMCSSYHNCTQCKDGMYLAEDKTCKSCPENCKQCLSSSDCNLCEERYYWTGTFCKLCGPYCKHCQSDSECTVCYRGFYQSDGKCIDCSPGCILCNEHAKCISCQEGYLLLDNKCTPCSKTYRCVNNICNDKNGVCTYGCVKGYWGSRCDHICSINCVDSECEKDNGTCTKGCSSAYKGRACDCPTNCVCDKKGCISCIQGFGETCEKPCGEGCPESKCNRTTGECFFNCLKGFSGKKCDKVSETIPCVDIPCLCCRSGNCTESKERENLCEGCIAGYTGLTCIEPCPANCINCSQLFLESERICYQCKNGFYNGHYQDLPNQPLQQDCALPCKTDCKMCSSYHNCTQCKDGMYLAEDKTCKSCPENCKLCLSSSDCNLCEDRYYWTGTFCKLCGPYCKHCQSDSECTVCYRGFYQSDGKCIGCSPGCILCNEHAKCISCQEGYLLLDNKCTPCSKTYRCVNNICNDKNGVCTYGCVKGYWGSRCDHICSINCVDSECEKNNGTCTKGCIATYKGSACDCPTNCVCDKQGCISCIQGFGETCEKPCGKGCPESKCNRTTGECFSNCLQGFSGKKCDKGKATAVVSTVPVLMIILGCLTAVLLSLSIFLGIRKRFCMQELKSPTEMTDEHLSLTLQNSTEEEFGLSDKRKKTDCVELVYLKGNRA